MAAGHQGKTGFYHRLAAMVASIGIWTGCTGSAVTGEASWRQDSAAWPREGGYSVVSESLVDTTNRFLAAVRVSTRFKREEGTVVHTCSGVLIDEQLVLTAGHCVCIRRKASAPDEQGRFIVDKSTCAQAASVQTLRYKPLREEEEGGLRGVAQWPVSVGTYDGAVRPNPRLKIVYASDMDNQEMASEADLAVIRLNTSLKDKAGVARLAREQVRVNEAIVMVGYGATEPGGEIEGMRRIGMNRVVSVEESAGRLFRVTKPLFIPSTFEQGEPLFMREDGSYVLAGDSGGPGFREEEDGSFSLVGIAKTAYMRPVNYSEYTSTYAYRAWLESEISNTRKPAERD